MLSSEAHSEFPAAWMLMRQSSRIEEIAVSVLMLSTIEAKLIGKLERLSGNTKGDLLIGLRNSGQKSVFPKLNSKNFFSGTSHTIPYICIHFRNCTNLSNFDHESFGAVRPEIPYEYSSGMLLSPRKYEQVESRVERTA